jgi:hypothetical protein
MACVTRLHKRVRSGRYECKVILVLAPTSNTKRDKETDGETVEQEINGGSAAVL